MCGIVWAKSLRENKSINNRIWQLYKDQCDRGSEGFGFVMFDDEGIKVHRAETEEEIKTKVLKNNAHEILFHHRYPTSTPNVEDATHPIKVSHKSLKHDYYVVHNGIISNTEMLKAKHDKLGFVYTTSITETYHSMTKDWTQNYFNDSECLAIELALCIEGKQLKSEAVGSASAIVLQISKKSQKPKALYYGRNAGNPLKYYESKKSVSITSEHPKGELIDTGYLFRLDYKTNEVTNKPFMIADYKVTPSTYGYGYNSRSWTDDDDDRYGVGSKSSLKWEYNLSFISS